jgi:hypothetical protein
MKLKMHSFDFEECTLTFSVPKNIMHSNSFGNVSEGVEVDLVAITRNAALKTVEAGQPAHNISVMPCPAFVKGEHCTVLRVAMCPDAPCDLSRARA